MHKETSQSQNFHRAVKMIKHPCLNTEALLVTGRLVGVVMVQIWAVWTRTTAPGREPTLHYSCHNQKRTSGNFHSVIHPCS